jgi:hypothetical protein
MIRNASLNPNDSEQLVTTGDNHFRVWRIADGSLKLVQNKLNQGFIYTDHVWLEDDKLFTFCKTGEMILYEKFEPKREIDSAFQSEDPTYVTAVSKFSKGILISSNTGDMAMWVRSEENNSSSGKDPYDFIRKWQPEITKK